MQHGTTAPQRLGASALNPHVPNMLAGAEAAVHRLCSEAETGLASRPPERPSGRGGFQAALPGHSGRENPAFQELQSEPAELKRRKGAEG